MATYPGHFAGEQLKRRRVAFLRKHWWRIGVVLLVTAAVAGGLQVAFPHTEVPLWMLVVTAMLTALIGARQQLDGTYHLVSGLDAEKWTSSELRRHLPGGWHVVDWISFATHDVDHVVVGPGGVYAIETKFTDSKVDLGSSKGQGLALDWSNQASDGARSVRLLLRSLGHEIDAIPLVIVWGSEVSGTPHVSDHALILHRRELEKHLSTWEQLPPSLLVEQVKDMRDAVLEYRNMRVAYERSRGN